MSAATVQVYESDGSDGYSEGTWGYTVSYLLSDGREALSCDGGYSSLEAAAEAARKAEAASKAEVRS